jgi:hypothetical protein
MCRSGGATCDIVKSHEMESGALVQVLSPETLNPESPRPSELESGGALVQVLSPETLNPESPRPSELESGGALVQVLSPETLNPNEYCWLAGHVGATTQVRLRGLVG